MYRQSNEILSLIRFDLHPYMKIANLCTDMPGTGNITFDIIYRLWELWMPSIEFLVYAGTCIYKHCSSKNRRTGNWRLKRFFLYVDILYFDDIQEFRENVRRCIAVSWNETREELEVLYEWLLAEHLNITYIADHYWDI